MTSAASALMSWRLMCLSICFCAACPLLESARARPPGVRVTQPVPAKAKALRSCRRFLSLRFQACPMTLEMACPAVALVWIASDRRLASS